MAFNMSYFLPLYSFRLKCKVAESSKVITARRAISSSMGNICTNCLEKEIISSKTIFIEFERSNIKVTSTCLLQAMVRYRKKNINIFLIVLTPLCYPASPPSWDRGWGLIFGNKCNNYNFIFL